MQTSASKEVRAARASGDRIRCPACGEESSAQSVFCEHADCRKALGGFRFVREEVARATRWYDDLADRAAAFIGKPQFLVVHLGWFVVWGALNAGIVAGIEAFDAYPFDFLAFILGVEAIVVTGFLLISQNRQNAHADKRAELDYEVNVRTYRAIAEIARRLDAMGERLDAVAPGQPSRAVTSR